MSTIKKLYIKSILKQEIGWFDQNTTGSLTTRISGDTSVMGEAMGEKVGSAVQFLSTFVFGFLLGFVKGRKLTLVLLATTPLLAGTAAFMSLLLDQLTTKSQDPYADAGSIATEVISGIKTIASFNAESKETERYFKGINEAKKIGIKKGFFVGFGMGAPMLVAFGSFGLALWYGGQLVKDGEYTGGIVLMVLIGVITAAFSLGQAGKTIKHLEGNIRIKDVTFRYSTRQQQIIWKKLNLKIKKGSTVALVGESGSGKSTVVQLLQKFYDPEKGSIQLDNPDLKDLNVNWLRSQIGLVSQEPVLFSGTIAENISWGAPHDNPPSLKQIKDAAKSANAHNFISEYPDGYNTKVGEKGAQLSGGQKQRIAIAGAIIKNPKILLLDEATSALDTESEKIVQDALDKVMKGRTTIIVAHRLSTIRNSDKIAVIDCGNVCEQGTHDELIEKKGMYYSLVQKQVSN